MTCLTSASSDVYAESGNEKGIPHARQQYTEDLPDASSPALM